MIIINRNGAVRVEAEMIRTLEEIHDADVALAKNLPEGAQQKLVEAQKALANQQPSVPPTIP
jgi:hypothetical protein